MYGLGIGGGNNPFMGSVDQWQQANAGPGYNVQNYGGNATGMGVNTAQSQMDERAALQKLMQGGNASQQARAGQMYGQMGGQPQMSQPMRPPQQGGLMGGMGGYGQQNPMMQMLMQRMGGGYGQPSASSINPGGGMPYGGGQMFGGGQQMRPSPYGGQQQSPQFNGGFGGSNALMQLLMQRFGGQQR